MDISCFVFCYGGFIRVEQGSLWSPKEHFVCVQVVYLVTVVDVDMDFVVVNLDQKCWNFGGFPRIFVDEVVKLASCPNNFGVCPHILIITYQHFNHIFEVYESRYVVFHNVHKVTIGAAYIYKNHFPLEKREVIMTSTYDPYTGYYSADEDEQGSSKPDASSGSSPDPAPAPKGRSVTVAIQTDNRSSPLEGPAPKILDKSSYNRKTVWVNPWRAAPFRTKGPEYRYAWYDNAVHSDQSMFYGPERTKSSRNRTQMPQPKRNVKVNPIYFTKSQDHKDIVKNGVSADDFNRNSSAFDAAFKLISLDGRNESGMKVCEDMFDISFGMTLYSLFIAKFKRTYDISASLDVICEMAFNVEKGDEENKAYIKLNMLDMLVSKSKKSIDTRNAKRELSKIYTRYQTQINDFVLSKTFCDIKVMNRLYNAMNKQVYNYFNKHDFYLLEASSMNFEGYYNMRTKNSLTTILQAM